MLVEAAIILPLLLMLTLGAIEYGWLFLNAQQVTNAARQGARVAILPHANAQAEAEALINTLLNNAGLSDNSPVVNITPETIGGRPGIRVQISIPTVNLLIVNAPALIPVPATIGSNVAMAREGA